MENIFQMALKWEKDWELFYMTLEIVTHAIRMTAYGVCDNCMTIANDWLRLKNKRLFHRVFTLVTFQNLWLDLTF